ncbi:MAG TPA: hypothetical protein VHU22_11590 [Xanthobacteraceae bacterium]|jgi:hypothetical protein|nr:hypothetical protein [Xanthobacteraceae bacterium]
MSADVEFCKKALDEIASLGSTTSLRSKVKQFLVKRLPQTASQRVELKTWALAELARLETKPGGGMSKVTSNVGEVSRRMATLQTVIEEIEIAEAATEAASKKT